MKNATNTIWDSWETPALKKLKIHDGHFKNLTFSGIEWDEPKVLHIYIYHIPIHANKY